MLWSLIVLLFVVWLAMMLLHVGGGLIHLILVAAVVVFLINLFTGRRAVV